MFDGLQADWRLQKTSPEVNAGLTVGIQDMLFESDVYGKDRIIGDTIDKGAAEYDFVSEIEDPLVHEDNFKVYPNPFSGQFWIEVEKKKDNFRMRI